MLREIEQLRATRGQFKNYKELNQRFAADPQLRVTIERLYKQVFRREMNKNCSLCWFEAYLELILEPLENIKNMEEKQCKFALRAGAILIDPTSGDNKKTATNVNLTDELALYHLARNPSCRRLFTQIPDNLDELLEGMTMQTKKAEKTQKKQQGKAGKTSKGKATEAPDNDLPKDNDPNTGDPDPVSDPDPEK